MLVMDATTSCGDETSTRNTYVSESMAHSSASDDGTYGFLNLTNKVGNIRCNWMGIKLGCFARISYEQLYE